MDTQFLDELINDVINNNNKEYDSLDSLLLKMSDDEVNYFINGCGEKIYHNNSLTLILWKTHPELFYESIIAYVDKKIERTNTILSNLRRQGFTDDNQTYVMLILVKDRFLELKKLFTNGINEYRKNM